jgi:hypothetical protein
MQKYLIILLFDQKWQLEILLKMTPIEIAIETFSMGVPFPLVLIFNAPNLLYRDTLFSN